MHDKEEKPKVSWILLIPVIFLTIIGLATGLYLERPLEGLFWGFGAGALITISIYVWELLQIEMGKGKLFPYIILGTLAGAFSAIFFSGGELEGYLLALPASVIIGGLVATILHHHDNQKS